MPTKTELMDTICARILEQLPEGQASQVEEFVRQYYGWVAKEDLIGRTPIDLYGAALTHWSLAQKRKPGDAKVRVYNPRHEEHGWQSTHTAIEIVNDDMPFLVDSTRMELNRLGYAIHLMVHAVIKVRRDEEGRLVEILPPGEEHEGATSESVMHVEVDQHTEPEVLEELRDNLVRVLGEVRVAVEDWPEMRGKVRDICSDMDREELPVEPDEVSEVRAFLEWVEDNHFTFLGYREYDLATEDGEDVLRTVPDSGLGILRQPGSGPISRGFAKLPPEVRAQAHDPHLLNLTKANSRSPVHRPSYLDYIGVKRFDESENVIGERRFLGLYTFTAYSSSALKIPIVRRKVRRVLERAGFPEGSHNEKDLLEILETHPRDELFQISEDELFEISMGILHLQERQRTRLFVRRDVFRRFFSCLVYVPRDRYNTSIRERMQDILQRVFQGENSEFEVRLSESVLARLHFVIYTKLEEAPDYDVDEIEARLVEATRAWTDNLYDALIEQCGEENGTNLYHKYRDAFPPGYRDGFLARTAVADIRKIEDLGSEDDVGMSLHHPLEEPEDFLEFKLFREGEQVSLSAILPLLENMGVEVVDERPHKIEPAGSPSVWIYDFGLTYDAQDQFQTDEIKDAFQDAFARAWRGLVENDGFNRLVLGAGLTWREASILRAYSRYLRQTNITFSQTYIEETLVENPQIARLLVDLFKTRFDPDRQAQAEKASEGLKEEIEAALDEVASLDQDRILRSFLNVTLAALRTNYYQSGPDGEPKPYISFKLDSQRIPELPLPRPVVEIFVYSPRTEGVHLRGGMVARGGIRWSDRREDFRTEVLGLMKAQMVKNAVIVPVGAKGGFVVKQPPRAGGREALMEEVVACYRTLIHGMLDITDNLADEGPVPPPDVVRYDGDDSYLVVAADKGTATFSDIANGISEDYGFWLGDAFASGGSTGYDHKKMGITARGAWESVKRHFRELDLDVQSEDFTVVGIGDMSGDVFGNGVLLSRHIKLVAAFNHLHIFLDPDPDPASSFEERERLFKLPRSSWTDYDERLISEGGGIYERTAKSLQISPQIREMLEIEAETLTPNELISALLKSPVYLLWNGGIGTYVKSSGETNAEVGDKSNDALRVDGRDLRCRVVGEGGNLGFTQLGRIEYALEGGRINTDAIDNSAGVDCSDHEVNIKVLVDSVVADGEMTGKQRNRLLKEMTEEVGQLVLRDNYLQTQALGNAIVQSAPMVDVHARYIRSLEATGKLDREIEFLPDDEILAERKSNGQGLTAPEFAVLLAYTKLTLYDRLLDSDVPEDPYLSRELERYFPAPLRERFDEQMKEHRLQREITATQVTNSIVNRAGTSFVFRMEEETGAPASQIARAYTAARETFGLRDLWASIEALDNQVSIETQTGMLLSARKLAERATRWLLRHRRPHLDIAETVSYFSEGAKHLSEHLPEIVLDGQREALEANKQKLVEAGVPNDLAIHAVGLDQLFSALDIVDIASTSGQPVETVASVYFTLGDRLHLHWLRDRVEALPRQDRWQTLARAALRDDLYGLQAELASGVIQNGNGQQDAPERIETWVSENKDPSERAVKVLSDVNSTGVFDLSTLSVAVREVRNLVNATVE